MYPYHLPLETRKKLLRHHRAFQAAIAVIANRKFGQITMPRGIGKYQGGIHVNGREIAIYEGTVADDWRRNVPPKERHLSTPEERATVAAIYEVAILFRREGAKALKRFDKLEGYSNPLQSMLGDPFGEFLPTSDVKLPSSRPSRGGRKRSGSRSTPEAA